MAKSRATCAHCGSLFEKENGHITRSLMSNAPLYCGMACAGMQRRKNKTKRQKVAEKAQYDAEYRAKNLALLKAKKRARHLATYDPAVAAIVRKARMPLHLEYCRRPEYREKKAVYDRKLRSQEYGDFAEAFMLMMDVRKEALARQSDTDIRAANGTLNKKLQRRRDYENIVGR